MSLSVKSVVVFGVLSAIMLVPPSSVSAEHIALTFEAQDFILFSAEASDRDNGNLVIPPRSPG